ncbi:thiamine diphosphokinase [Staphylococcus canis]|uniref:Thiamine diphosphokinase n=1 Tax=Staphylococcus canis TaxID=2724942 RepID=A0ABS0T748_9STAP|nr:thiamine diphosphokinase [Staphylococcus canis]MBI5974568.1 thiamine diphosphokinase [Staphylococcus canis]
MKKSIHLLCSRRHLPKNILSRKVNESWAGVDSGTVALLKEGIQPVFAVGDFDSISYQERQWVSEKIDIQPEPAEKADTDLAIAVTKAVKMGYQKIKIYGATGARLDHFMGAMQLLKYPDFQKIKIQIIDDKNTIELLTPNVYEKRNKKIYDYISFVPASDEVTLSLKGFKYNLDHEVLREGSTLTISNEFEGKYGTIEVHQGLVYQIRSRD